MELVKSGLVWLHSPDCKRLNGEADTCNCRRLVKVNDVVGEFVSAPDASKKAQNLMESEVMTDGQ